MIVRFATLCDTCQRRSEEYTGWPSCRECAADCCNACAHPNTYRENDGRESVICPECARYAVCARCIRSYRRQITR